MLPVEPLRLRRADEELRSVRVGPRIRHRQNAGAGVLLHEILVGELGAVDGLAAGAVSGGEVATLAHEVGDDAVEGGALVVEGLATATHSLLAGAEGAEVLGGPRGRVGEQLHHDAADGLASDGHVEEHPRVCHFRRAQKRIKFGN